MKKSFLKNFILLGLFSIFLLGNINFTSAQISSTPFMSGQAGASEAQKFYKEAQDTVRNWAGGLMSDFAKTVIQPFVKTGAVFVLKIIQFLMYLSGKIFDMVIEITIENKPIFGNKSLLDGFDISITAAWKILRDIANIIIVFSLLYIGIKTILNGNGFAEKKVLLNVLLAAVLINFSLIITKTTFEVSNIIGGQIANQITFTGQNSGYGGVKSISSGLMGMIRPDYIMNMMWNEKFNSNDWGEMWRAVQTAVFTGITLLFMIVIFFTASILLLYRFIIFIVLMITSPFGLISKLIPWLNKLGDWWWNTLKSQSIVLPAFFLTLYISILFISPLTSELKQNSGGLAGAATAGATISQNMMNGAVEFFFSFLLIIGFLLLPLIVPSKVGAAGASMMTSAANWTSNKIRNLPKSSGNFARTKAGGAVAGGAARIGRQVGGRLVGDKYLNSDKLKAVALKDGWKGSAARQLLKTGGALRNATYDVRNTKAGASLGFGKGISNWGDEVKARKARVESEMEKEKKQLGFDKLKNSREEIAEAEGKRNKQGEVVKKLNEELKTAQAGNATQAELKVITDKIAKEEKDLEKAEIIVGELKNRGDSEYLKLMQARHKRLLGTSRYSVAQAQALKKIKEEYDKKWKEAGKYVSEKKKKNSSESTSTTTQTTPTMPIILDQFSRPARGS